MKVPFFDYPRAYLDDRSQLLDTIDSVASRGAFILQRELEEFEANLANYAGAKFCVGVANGTDAMELIWLALGIEPGDEVIISAHTMLATASAIRIAGGVPVPVDIGDDWMIDPESVENAITEKTVAIAPTQLNGRTCDMASLNEIATKNRLVLVEDAAQALGSKFEGKMAGSFGVGGSYSFYPAKVLGSLGDAGAVMTSDEALYEKVFQLHDHGRDRSGEVRCWGRNSRMDNIQAAILKMRLDSYSKAIARRRHLAAIYDERLKGNEFISLPPGPMADSAHFDVYQNYEICARRRDDLRAFLSNQGVGTIIQWGGKAVHQFEALAINKSLPRVEVFFEHCLLLPMNTFLSDDDVHFVCDKIDDFYGVLS